MSTNIAEWMNEVIEHQARNTLRSVLGKKEVGVITGIIANGSIYTARIVESQNSNAKLIIHINDNVFADDLDSFDKKYLELYKNKKIVTLLKSIQNDIEKDVTKFERYPLSIVVDHLKADLSERKKISKSELVRYARKLTKSDIYKLLDWMKKEGIKISDKSHIDAEVKILEGNLKSMAEYKMFNDPELDRYEKALIYGAFLERGRRLIAGIKDEEVKKALKLKCRDDLLIQECF